MNDDELMLHEASGWMQLGEPTRARMLLQEMTPDGRARYEAVLLYCHILAAEGRWELVEPVAVNLAERYPQQWVPAYLLAECAAQRHDLPATKRCLQRAFVLAPMDIRQLARNDPALEPFWDQANGG